MLSLGQPTPSRYIRTSWILSAKEVLSFPDFSKIRFISSAESNKLAEQVRKRNVFARHSWENNFYIQRVKGLADKTVIEVLRPGDPRDTSNEAEKVASALEKITILSSAIVLNRAQFQRKLGISSNRRTETNFVISPEFRFLSSRERPELNAKGVCIDKRFCKRFSRCGFDVLAGYILTNSDIARRISLSLDWLFESRTEAILESSFVKTSIALESLLIFSESESLAQPLSERAAFILSSNPNRRQQISRIIKSFYDARSGIVHGSRKKAKKATPDLLEAVDRLVIMLCLAIAANSKLWPSSKELREWCETQRWGEPSREIKIPFPDLYLRNGIKLTQRENV